MTKVTHTIQPEKKLADAANLLTNSPDSEGSRPVVYEHFGFRQLLAESGVDHLHGILIMRLTKMCAGAYDRILGERMRNEEISLPQWRILNQLYLEELNGQDTLSPTDLARRQRLSKNTISAHLRALEKLRFINRRQHPNDLRAFRIRLTTGGRDLVRSSTPGHFEFLNELVAQLSPEECEMLQELLLKLVESLQRKQDENSTV